MSDDPSPVEFTTVSRAWLFVDTLTIREAAWILTDTNPGDSPWNRSETSGMHTAITRAVECGQLPHVAAWAQPFDGRDEPDSVTGPLLDGVRIADCTTIRVAELAAWCEFKSIPHPFTARKSEKTHGIPSNYPPKLRAAIEAFNALHDNPSKLRGKSPKQAIKAWLEVNTELGPTARSDVAKVANWEPGGGPGTHHHD